MNTFEIIIVAAVAFYFLILTALVIQYKRTPEPLKGVRKLNGHFQMPGTPRQ